MKAFEMLKHTAGLVEGPRAADYGDKLVNHQRIADLWNVWINNRQGTWRATPYDVAVFMMMVKMARLMQTPGHQDSHVDIAGYASIMEEIANGGA